MQTFRNSLSYLLIVGLIGVFYSTAGAQDDLILWFAFEGSGNVAEDASGNGNDGTIVGATRAPGKYGKGIAIGRNNQYVEISNILQPATTVAFWFKPNWDGGGTGTYRLFDASTGSIYYMIGKGKTTGDRDTTFGLYLEDASDADFQDWEIPATEAIPSAGQWYHIAVTWDFAAGVSTFYINGQEVGNVTGLGQFPTLNANPKIGFNVGTNYMPAQNGADGVIDEFLIYARALSMQEIQEVMKKGFSPGVASAPSPANEATDVLRDLMLNWTPGEYAPAVNGHIVYLSESFADVNDGAGGATQDASNYDPGRLEFNTTYYWRVDEVNAPPDSTVYKGKVWSFSTEPIGYPIDGANITATASSAGQANFGPEKTIDGSGLDENDLHSTQAEDMWLSDNEPLGPWLQYEFDKLYKLHEMWVWNSNQIFEALFGFGMKDVAVEYSTNGTDWTALADVPQFNKAPGAIGYAHDTTVDFGGAAAKYVKITATSNWGGILPQYGLSEVRFFAIPVGARKPSPDSGAADVNPAMVLTWRAGREAAMHNVYVSTDEQSVIDGTVPAVSVTDASYNSDLDLANTYYWRIDEVNDVETPTTWPGDVWSFSTAEYLVVDDFESYNDIDPPDTASHRIFESWIDGYNVPTNGALVGNDLPPYAETTIVHSGIQSIPLFYSNTGGASFSEAERTFVSPQNWTKHGVTTLAIWFHGTTGNTGQMYIKINGSKISYDGQAGNIALPGWQLWNVDLTSSGLNLQSVTRLAIGIDGNGAAGTLYFDDITLYAVAPVPVVEVTIANDDDDVEERIGPNNGAIDMTSSDLEMPYEDSGRVDPQIVGLRFTGIAVPQGATITDAWVQFQVDETKEGTQPVNLIIEGELSTSPAMFSSTAGDLSARPATAAKVQWSVPNWTNVGDAGPDQRTPNLVSIIQEIVNQPGWAGEAIVLIIRDDPANPSTGIRCAVAGPGNDAVMLHIDYQ